MKDVGTIVFLSVNLVISEEGFVVGTVERPSVEYELDASCDLKKFVKDDVSMLLPFVKLGMFEERLIVGSVDETSDEKVLDNPFRDEANSLRDDI